MSIKPGNKEQVRALISAGIEVASANPKELLISATGQVLTLGWSNPELVPYVYIQAPPDGYYDFDFVAQPPSTVAGEALSHISVKQGFPLPDGLKGVRIHSATNSIEVPPKQDDGRDPIA